MTTYFTSDLHLGHQHVLPSRPQFKDIDEHDEFLIERWNSKVGKNDEVYILGDLSFRSSHHILHYLMRMNGKKRLIVGNHDIYWMKHTSTEDMEKYFGSIDYLKTFKFEKKQITCCHYPMLEFPGSRYIESGTSFLIHGHIHAAKDAETYGHIRKYQPHALNAGVDINGFEPVTFEELKKNNDLWYERDEKK